LLTFAVEKAYSIQQRQRILLG